MFTGIAEAVHVLPDEALLEFMERRHVVEPEVTALAARRASPEHLDGIETQLVASILNGTSGVTVRARVWRALVEEGSREESFAAHRAIYRALLEGDPPQAHAAALLHVASVEGWLRSALTPEGDSRRA